MECEKRYCMCNLDGTCVHTMCPMTNPDYKRPEAIADEKEKQMRELYLENLRLKKEKDEAVYCED